MKLQQVIKKEEYVEKEIPLPYFCKLGDGSYFKVITEERIVIVKLNTLWAQIQLYELIAGHGGDIAKGQEITEQEFNEAYHKALFEIGKYVPLPDISKSLVYFEDENINTESVNQ